MATRAPLPIAVRPSGSFDGADGAWSTFNFNVGGDGGSRLGQNFKMLPSTSRSTTLLPLEAAWCDTPSPSQCAERRGVLPYNSQQGLGYQPNASSHYQSLGLFNLEVSVPALSPPESGRYGLTSIGAGLAAADGLVLGGQLVAGYVAEEPFLPSVGLANTLIDVGAGGLGSYLAGLNASGLIPSLSYSYTAGAKYRDKGVPGSLVLGGYDSSRLDGGVSISMPGPTNSTLVAGVQSITISSSAPAGGNVYSATAGSSGFFAVIDSSSPYLWLPPAVCDAFETAFALTYDSASGRYLVNDTARERNRARGMLVSLQVGNAVEAGAGSVSIDMPYDAFDLEAGFPLFPTATRYFPIRRAVGGVSVVGRVFLQEAMLVVDYGRRNFTVGRARFPSPLPPADIVAIAGPQASGRARASKTNAIAVALPIVCIALFVALAMALWHFRCRSARRASGAGEGAPMGAGSAHPLEADASPEKFELESPLGNEEKERAYFRTGTSVFPTRPPAEKPTASAVEVAELPAEVPPLTADGRSGIFKEMN